MKKVFIILTIAMAFSAQSQTVSKPPTFLQEFEDFYNKLYDYTEAKFYGGDTLTTRSLMESAGLALKKYNVASELQRLGPIGTMCQLSCAGQFWYCRDFLNMPEQSYQFAQCVTGFYNCMQTCGYFPVLKN